MIQNEHVSISVCLLVYNHRHILEKIIESILTQTLNDFEFIISDDNSTDSSWDVIQKFANNNTIIKAIKTPVNLGMAGNANYAISKSKGDFIALLHHDDKIDSRLLEKWVDVINKSYNIAFVFNEYNLGNGVFYHKIMKYDFNEIMSGKIFLKKFLLKSWGCPVRGTALIRKKHFDEVGGMDERFGMLADVDLWMRLASKYDVGYVKLPLIEVLENRPVNYPKDYTEFTWSRIFLLFDIHSSNVNQKNFPNYIHYLIRRFIFRNKVSFIIIKWHLYAVYKNKYQILETYTGKYKYELFYSVFTRWVINYFYKNKFQIQNGF